MEIIVEIRVGRREQIEPRAVAREVVHLVGHQDLLERNVVRAQVLDQLGRLLRGHVAIVIGLHDQHRPVAGDLVMDKLMATKKEVASVK